MTEPKDIYQTLIALGITLPPLSIPAAAYVPYVQTGNLIFLSGHIAKKNGQPWVGQLGKDTTLEDGKAAARAIGIDLLGTLHAALVAERPGVHHQTFLPSASGRRVDELVDLGGPEHEDGARERGPRGFEQDTVLGHE